MELLKLPEELLDTIVSHCELSSLLQLRLVSTRLKELVDGSKHFRNALQDVQMNLHISTLSIFVEQASHLPFTNFSLDMSKHVTTHWDPIEDSVMYRQTTGWMGSTEETLNFYNPTSSMKTFIKRVCPEIRKLKVSTMFGCTVNSEFEFFKSLKKLRALEIGELRALTPGKTITPDAAKELNLKPPRIPWGETKLLKRIIVDKAVDSEKYLVDLIKSSPCLEMIKAPTIIEETVTNTSTSRVSDSSFSAIPSVLKLGAENRLEHLKSLDTNFQVVPSCGCSSEEYSFFLKLLSNKTFRMEKVAPWFLEDVQDSGMDLRDKLNFKQRIFSTKGIAEGMKGGGLENLEEMSMTFKDQRRHMGVSAIGEATWNFNLSLLELPALKKISARISDVTSDHPEIEHFLECLFTPAEPRGTVKDMNIRYLGKVARSSEFGSDSDYDGGWMVEEPQRIRFHPSFLDVTFPNLVRLVLKTDLFSQDEFCELVEIVSRKTMLEELSLSCGNGISERAFFGNEVEGVPPFLKLANLRKLKLETGFHKACRGVECGHENVGRRVVEEIIAGMSLVRLEIVGDGWKDVMSLELRALETGPCGRSLLWAKLPGLEGAKLEDTMHPEGLKVAVERLCHANRLAKGITSSSFEEFKASEGMFTGRKYPFRNSGWADK